MNKNIKQNRYPVYQSGQSYSGENDVNPSPVFNIQKDEECKEIKYHLTKRSG